MKRSYLAAYLLIALLALAPAGLRALTWVRAHRTPIDPGMAQAGQTLFSHNWTPNDPLAVGGDGLGPVFNATSCVACHDQGGVGGSGGLEHNVNTFRVSPLRGAEQAREGVVHAFATGPAYQENLAHVHTDLPAITRPALAQLVPLDHTRNLVSLPPGVTLSQRNTPALFGARLIDEVPERILIAQERSQRLQWGMVPSSGEQVPVGRALRLTDGRVGRFGWKAQSASLAEFVQAACANELGLGNPGQAQPRPLGMPVYQTPGLDLSAAQCDQMTAFIASLPRPSERLPDDSAGRDHALTGKQLFRTVGCADCHTPNLGSVEGIYSDQLLHRMGQPLEGGGSYNEPPPPPRPDSPGSGQPPLPDEWRTPPLWGVADSAPYLHDGRAATLEEAIQMHGGQGARSAQRFALLSPREQAQLILFLKSLRAP